MTLLPDDDLQIVLEAVRELEARFDLFDWEWSGIPFWSAFRPFIIEKILQQVSGVGPAQQAKATRTSERMRNALSNISTRNPWLWGNRARFLVARWERGQIVDGREAEPLSDAVGSALPGSVIYLDMTGKKRGKANNTWSVESINIAAKLSKRTAPFFETAPKTTSIEEWLHARLGVNLDLKVLLKNRVNDTVARRDLYRKLLEMAQIEQVWSVVSYANPSLILAAKLIGLPVVDIQHGLLNYAYDGIGARTDVCLPDRLALFGDRWTRSLSNPFGVRHSTIGVKHIRERLDTTPALEREDFLLVLSQPMIRERLLTFAMDVARLTGAPKIIYRLHPGDDQLACERMISVASDVKNFVLDRGGGAGRTLELQARAHAQLGTFSTAVLEGVALGTPTLIFPATGYSLIVPYLSDSAIVMSPGDTLERYFSAIPRLQSPETIDPFFSNFNIEAVDQLSK
ncbi:hypothetical protein [Hephaestia mangrovi]|uniref:hypothetical protein n=1 Tax=Hephaestia mangrovi TaxID=2873268 RepID=UPI001CA6D302|nr:hypothetical protein [Hephaestia mangrovi]MBY8829925.1 hypothetical protein [Hephaestia mangrovi]